MLKAAGHLLPVSPFVPQPPTIPLPWPETQLFAEAPLYCLPFLLPPTVGEGNSALSPLNPGELLIALHNIDSVKCDMKSIIKGEAPLFPHAQLPQATYTAPLD